MENKTGKYFKYAIGEIILVVIGILIAIQLNEWRNDIVNTKQKQKVLVALKLDFEENLLQLDGKLENQEKSFWKFRKTRDLIDSINYITDNTVLKENLGHGGYSDSFNPFNGALRSAMSSGDIHLVKGERLTKLLFTWEDLVIDSYEEIELLVSYGSDPYYRLIHSYTQARDLGKKLPDDKGSKHSSNFVGLFKDPLFENYTQQMFYYSFNYIKELKKIRINNLEILKLIEQELKK
ncbi:hypothetical protein K8354_04480 [Polaribacter litorisediminis]|uniref:DUF6090 family protein n=1 Tax=Polaribacter litorisediminis TaxID=1908341 RepID=UPI001CBC4E94|nr:DUF6090 family protein [Polaribacter litorisediminis]UAM99087.1 hypothetical protein K8354_04480 [Polaribacter litorisediminis]